MLAFRQLAHDDVDRAMARADAPGGGRALKAMAKQRLANGAHDEAVRLLEAALHGNLATEYSQSDDQTEIVSQAEIGALAIAAGRDEWGRQLVNDAADRVERLAAEGNELTRSRRGRGPGQLRFRTVGAPWEMQPPPRMGWSGDPHAILAVSVGVYDSRRGGTSLRSPARTNLLVEASRGFEARCPQSRQAALRPCRCVSLVGWRH